MSKEQAKPLGESIGVFIGMYEGTKTTPFTKKMMLNHLQILLAEAKRVDELERKAEQLQKALEHAKSSVLGIDNIVNVAVGYGEGLDYGLLSSELNRIANKASQSLKGSENP